MTTIEELKFPKALDKSLPKKFSLQAKRYTFELYQDAKKEWRSRIRHTNGNVVFDSAEGYKRRIDCLTTFLNFIVSVRTEAWQKILTVKIIQRKPRQGRK